MLSQKWSSILLRKQKFTPSDSKLSRTLLLKDLISMGVSATLGAGVYILSGEVARKQAGPAVMICFAIAALVSILSGMCYAELGCRVPKAGSGYAYLYVALGEFSAFSIGWCLVLSHVLGTSSVAAAFTDYLNDMTGGYIVEKFNWIRIGMPGFRETLDIFSMIVIFMLCTVLCLGVNSAKYVTNFCTTVNLGTILLITVIFSADFDVKNWFLQVNDGQVEDFYRYYFSETSGVKNEFGGSFSDKYCVTDPFIKNRTRRTAVPLNSNYESTGEIFELKCYLKNQSYHWNPSGSHLHNMLQILISVRLDSKFFINPQGP